MNYNAIGRLSAWLVALSAVELLTPLIDILSLPLPRYVMSMPWSTAFTVVALIMLVPLARRFQVRLIGCAAFSVLGLLVLWAGLEVAGAKGRTAMRFDLVIDCLSLLLVMIAARLHLRLFRDHRPVVSRFILMASCIVLAQTTMLLLVRLGLPMPSFLNGDELSSRNAMALLMPVCLWLLVFFPLKEIAPFSFRYTLLLMLGLANCVMNSGRAAMIVLLWCALIGLVSKLPLARRWLRASMLPLGLAIVASAALFFSFLSELGEPAHALIGQGDDALSIQSRAQTNAMLLRKLGEEPIVGLGWEEVAETRAYGYMGHTLYVNIVSSYGIVGALAGALLILFGLRGIAPDRREGAEHLLLLVLLIASFSNNVFVFFGLMIALVESAEPTHLVSGSKKNDSHASCASC